VPRTPTTAPTTTATTVPESPVLEKIDDPVVKAALEAVIVEEITPEAIETLASIDFDSLDQETLDAVSVALSDAPTEIKEQFEEEIDIFDGEFDEYVPVGSTVPVRTRRVIVVATTAMFVLPSPRSNSGGKR
jgi:hypothetical protein